MNNLLNHFNSPWAETLGWCLLHSIWQITAIAMLFWIALQLLRNASPDTRYWTGCATLILMAATPILTVNMLTTAPTDPASYSNAPANVTAMGGPTMIDTATFSNSSDEIAVSIVNPQSTNTGTANQVGVDLRAGIVEWIQPALPVLAGCWLAGVWVGLLRTTMGVDSNLKRNFWLVVQRLDR